MSARELCKLYTSSKQRRISQYRHILVQPGIKSQSYHYTGKYQRVQTSVKIPASRKIKLVINGRFFSFIKHTENGNCVPLLPSVKSVQSDGK